MDTNLDLLTALKPDKRGRKPRLSRAMITAEALQMLTEAPLEAFTLARLAKRLNAGVMSLYTYFSSRDELLDAVAEQIFAGFEAPAAEGVWQDVMLDWLWATQRLLDQYPVVLKVIFWDGHHSPAWLKFWWLPIAALFKRQGLDNQETAFAMNWFTTSAIGMMVAQAGSAQRKQPSVIARIAPLDADQQRLAAELWFCLGEVDRRDALAFGFRNLIAGLEKIIEKTVKN